MEPAGSAAVVLLCAEDDDLELVRWVHAARQQGLAPEVVTGIERNDGPLLEALQLTTEALFVVLRSDNLGADRMRAIKACFALHHGPAQKLVALRLDGTAEAAVERIAKQIVGGVRSRSESSLLLAIEGVAPALERVIAVPPSPAATGRATPSHGIALDALPGLRTPSADGVHPAIAASRAARAAAARRDPQPRSATRRAVPSAAAPSFLPPRAAVPNLPAPSVAVPSAAVPSVAVPSVTVPSVTVPSVAVPSVTVPSVAAASVVAAPATQERSPAAPIVDEASAAPSLDHALEWAGRAHERARTGRYAIDDETLPMVVLDVVSPPVARTGSRRVLTVALAMLAVGATLGVTYVLLDATAASTAAVAPAAVIERDTAASGRVSIPVASETRHAVAIEAAPAAPEPSAAVAPGTPERRTRARPRAPGPLPAPPTAAAPAPIAAAAQPLPELAPTAAAPIDDALPSEPAPLEADLAGAAP